MYTAAMVLPRTGHAELPVGLGFVPNDFTGLLLLLETEVRQQVPWATVSRVPKMVGGGLAVAESPGTTRELAELTHHCMWILRV